MEPALPDLFMSHEIYEDKELRKFDEQRKAGQIYGLIKRSKTLSCEEHCSDLIYERSRSACMGVCTRIWGFYDQNR